MSQRLCISNGLPGGAGAVDPWTTLEKQVVNARCLEQNNICSVKVPICRNISKSLNDTRQNLRYKSVGLIHQSLPGIPTDFSCQNIIIPRYEQVTIINN